MRAQILVAIGALLFDFVHPSSANPLHHTNAGLATIEPHGTANNNLPNLESLLKREEWVANLGNGWASYVQTWESYIRKRLPAPNCSYSIVFGGIETVPRAISSKEGSHTLVLAREWKR